jgi:DCN1-like protein 1/2
MKLCEELAVELDDVVLIALAYELKAPNVGEWTKKGWLDGWKTLK